MSTPSERRKLGLPPVNLSTLTPTKPAKPATGGAAPTPSHGAPSIIPTTHRQSAERRQPPIVAEPADRARAEPSHLDAPRAAATGTHSAADARAVSHVPRPVDEPAACPIDSTEAASTPARAAVAPVSEPSCERTGARADAAAGDAEVARHAPDEVGPQNEACGACEARKVERPAVPSPAPAPAPALAPAPAPAPPDAMTDEQRASARAAEAAAAAAAAARAAVTGAASTAAAAAAPTRVAVDAPATEQRVDGACEHKRLSPRAGAPAPPEGPQPSDETPCTPPPAASKRERAEIAWASPGGVIECRMPLFAAALLHGLPAGATRADGADGAADGGNGGVVSIVGGGGGNARTGIPNAIAAASAGSSVPPSAAGAADSGARASGVVQRAIVEWSAAVHDGAVLGLAAHPTLPWLCVATARSLQLWAPCAAARAGDEPTAAPATAANGRDRAGGDGCGRQAPPLAAVGGARASLDGLPALAELRSGEPSDAEVAGWPVRTADTAVAAATCDDAEFAALAFGQWSGGAGGGGGAGDGAGDAATAGAQAPARGLLLAGCSDGRLFAFTVRSAGGERDDNVAKLELKLFWARRVPPPPLGSASTRCALTSLALHAPAKPAHARIGAVDGAGRMWLWSALAPSEPAQLVVPAVATAAARGARARRPVAPRLKTALFCTPAATADGAPPGPSAPALRLVGLISAAGQSSWATAWQLSAEQTPAAAAAVAVPMRPRRACAFSHTAATSSADGRWVLLGSGEGCVTLLDAASLAPLAAVRGVHSLPVTALLALEPEPAAPGARAHVRCLSVSADKRGLVTVLVPAYWSETLRIAAAVLVALLALVLALAQARARAS